MNREEAINVVKCNWPEGRHQLSEALRTLIPELQESEDEKITAEIVDFISRNAERGDDITKSAGWIAYLEKQKEYIEDIRQYAYNKGLVDAEEKQKPAKWSKEEKGILLGCISALQNSSHWLLADKLSSLRPQPHWEPSKEQMEALRISYKIGTANESWAMRVLETLYSDLKNL